MSLPLYTVEHEGGLNKLLNWLAIVKGRKQMNRREFFVPTAAGAIAPTFGATLSDAILPAPAFAQDGKEPLGGQPPAGSACSIKDFDYQIKYQRAFEAVLWNMPAIAIYSFRRAAFTDLGAKDNDIVAYSEAASPRLEALTANSTTPYIAAYTDLRKESAVLEVPAAGPEGSLYGQVVDAWQYTIADVGPSGLDKGQAAKYLFTGPDYKGPIPQGYIHVASPNYRIAFAFRSVPASGKTAADAYRYAKRLRMYFLSQADNPRNRSLSIWQMSAILRCRSTMSGISKTCMSIGVQI